MSIFHNALFLGDVDEEIRLFKEAGQYPLAYLIAKSHGLNDVADSIIQTAGTQTHPKIIGDAKLLKTATPIFRNQDTSWPIIEAPTKILAASHSAPETKKLAPNHSNASLNLSSSSSNEVIGMKSRGWGHEDLELGITDSKKGSL